MRLTVHPLLSHTSSSALVTLSLSKFESFHLQATAPRERLHLCSVQRSWQMKPVATPLAAKTGPVDLPQRSIICESLVFLKFWRHSGMRRSSTTNHQQKNHHLYQVIFQKNTAWVQFEEVSLRCGLLEIQPLLLSLAASACRMESYKLWTYDTISQLWPSS